MTGTQLIAVPEPLIPEEAVRIMERCAAAKKAGFSGVHVDFQDGKIINLRVETKEDHKDLKNLYQKGTELRGVDRKTAQVV